MDLSVRSAGCRAGNVRALSLRQPSAFACSPFAGQTRAGFAAELLGGIPRQGRKWDERDGMQLANAA